MGSNKKWKATNHINNLLLYNAKWKKGRKKSQFG
jgi:hypothetical protein